MRYSQSEKMEIISIVENSDLSVRATLKELDIPKATFYDWYDRYQREGFEGLAPKKRAARSQWNRIPDEKRQEVVELALDMEDLSSRELAWHIVDHRGWYISESSVHAILKERGLITAPAFVVDHAASQYKDKTSRVNQMWQTDFTYLKVVGHWGWYYLCTVLDDYSRYVIHAELCTNMGADDVQRNIDKAIEITGVVPDKTTQSLKVLSDNGPCYIAKDLAEFFQDREIKHVRGRVRHPQTQGKIERWHQSMKNVIKLDNYYSPDELRQALAEFIRYYNNRRYHESLENLTPADVFFGRDKQILARRKQTKERTMKQRRKFHRQQMLNL